MIYSLDQVPAFSQGAVPDVNMIHSTKVEIIWTIIPVVILVVDGDSCRGDDLCRWRTRAIPELTVRVTGYQWKWEYNVHGRGRRRIDYFLDPGTASRISPVELGLGHRPEHHARITCSRWDHPLVVPSGTKVRILLTSQDVIHAWYVPDFGAKRSAIPGLRQRALVQGGCQGKEGLYRGQCAALCGARPWLHAGGGRREARRTTTRNG